MTDLWQPWPLRTLVEDLREGRTTPAEALARSRARIAETEPEVRAWVEPGPPPGSEGTAGGPPSPDPGTAHPDPGGGPRAGAGPRPVGGSGPQPVAGPPSGMASAGPDLGGSPRAGEGSRPVGGSGAQAVAGPPRGIAPAGPSVAPPGPGPSGLGGEPEGGAGLRPVRGTAAPVPSLAGVPLGVKDIIDVAGYPTRCGSVLRDGVGAAAGDAGIVRVWRDAGAVVAGKTVTTEFAFFAPGPTRNPAAPGHTPGGSSSGSAAAVAAGQVPLAIGSQTAGSVTRPAAYCGVAALVMTHGRYPVDGVFGLSPGLDSHGVYAAGVDDLALAWSALTGTAPAAPEGPPRVLLWTAAPFDAVSDDMRRAVDGARARLTAAGAHVDPFPEDDLVAALTAAHPVVMAYEAVRERAAEYAAADRLSEPLARLLRTGAETSDAAYAAARATIDGARAPIAALLTSYDLILGPAAPGAAPAGLDATGDPLLSRAWQALGLPVVTVPGLRDPAGLPLGVQAVGAAHDETRLLAHAAWIQHTLEAR